MTAQASSDSGRATTLIRPHQLYESVVEAVSVENGAILARLVVPIAIALMPAPGRAVGVRGSQREWLVDLWRMELLQPTGTGY